MGARPAGRSAAPLGSSWLAPELQRATVRRTLPLHHSANVERDRGGCVTAVWILTNIRSAVASLPRLAHSSSLASSPSKASKSGT